MSEEPVCETYTLCFDWVIQATGSQPAALTYGVVWRYAQMSGARCYASCERLAEHLAWTRQSVMRHLRSLCRLGLVICANPNEPGVPHEYLPVSHKHWLGCHGPAAPAAPERARRRRRPARKQLDDTAPVMAPQDPALERTAPPESAAPDATMPETPPQVSEAPRSDPPDTPRKDAVASPSPASEAVESSISPAVAAHAHGAAETSPVTVSDTLEINTEGPVSSADTSCDKIAQPPVTSTDTKKTTRNTSKRRGGTAERRDPGILLRKKLTGRLPPAVLDKQVLGALGGLLPRLVRAWL